jgi:hypothetical protein
MAALRELVDSADIKEEAAAAEVVAADAEVLQTVLQVHQAPTAKPAQMASPEVPARKANQHRQLLRALLDNLALPNAQQAHQARAETPVQRDLQEMLALQARTFRVAGKALQGLLDPQDRMATPEATVNLENPERQAKCTMDQPSKAHQGLQDQMDPQAHQDQLATTVNLAKPDHQAPEETTEAQAVQATQGHLAKTAAQAKVEARENAVTALHLARRQDIKSQNRVDRTSQLTISHFHILLVFCVYSTKRE